MTLTWQSVRPSTHKFGLESCKASVVELECVMIALKFSFDGPDARAPSHEWDQTRPRLREVV